VPNDILAITARTETFTVVGVIAPMKLETLVTAAEPRMAGQQVGAYYFPIQQQPARDVTFAIRTDRDPGMMARTIRDAIQSVDPELPVFDLQPMERWTAKLLVNRRAAMLVSLMFSAIALLLAAVGIYGVLVYLVAARRKEIGIRLALGASARAAFRLIAREGTVLATTGLGIGAVGVAALQPTLRTQLIGTELTDPVVLAAVVGLVASVAAGACVIPAWRASRIEPRLVVSE